MNNYEKLEKEFSPEFRAKVRARTKELVADEMALRELRKALDRTQATVAKTLGITQDGVSRLEQRSDLLLSTLRGYINAIGGELKLIVELPHHRPVVLCGLGEIGDAKQATHSPHGKQGTKKAVPMSA
jgi:DNA-binding XRE family transcriptional regulator